MIPVTPDTIPYSAPPSGDTSASLPIYLLIERPLSLKTAGKKPPSKTLGQKASVDSGAA
jgi:hypothetical protein